MLLALNVGNTNVTVGAFEGETLRHTWRLETDPARSIQAYAADLKRLVGRRPLEGVALGSVVPILTSRFARIARDSFGVDPLVVDHRLDLGIGFAVDRPAEVGADRILNALAAYRLYGAPAIVVDFGTATTFDCLSEKGYYSGGAIVVGPRLAAEALAEKTAKLPKVEFAKPRRVIGKNTVECIQAGLYYGYLGTLERVLDETLREMGGRPRLIVTGGFGAIFAPLLSRKSVLDPDLTLQGLRLAFQTARPVKRASQVDN